MYKHCYFYIESGYMNVSAAQQEKFYDEILDLFLKNGWEIKRERSMGVCPEIRNGKSELYIHPQSLSGDIDVELIGKISNILNKGTQFKYYRFTDYGEVYDWSDAQYLEYLEQNKSDIENDLVKVFQTKRRNLYMQDGVLNGPLRDVREKYKRYRVGCDRGGNSDNLEWKYVSEIFKNLVLSGRILPGETRICMCFRTAKSEETAAIKNYLAWCKENDKPVNDSTVNEYSRETFNFSSKPDCDKMNILFGYSAFIKNLSEEQKGRVDVEDEELDL